MLVDINNKESVGELIRRYRIDKGLNQLELEVGIGASFGSLSRIESGKINPSKETLYKIIDFLNLPSASALKLFNINMSFLWNIVDQMNKIKDIKNLDEIMSMAIDDVRIELGLAGGAFYLIEGNELCLKTLSSTHLLSMVRRLVKDPFKMLRLDLDKHKDNLLVQSVLTGEIKMTNNLYDMVKPKMPKWMSDRSQDITFTRELLCIPIKSNGKVIGLVNYGSLTSNGFHYEIQPLQLFIDQLGIALGNLLENT